MKYFSSLFTVLFIAVIFNTDLTAQTINLNALVNDSTADSVSVIIEKAIQIKIATVDQLWQTIKPKYSTESDSCIQYEISILVQRDTLWRKMPRSSDKIANGDTLIALLQKLDPFFIEMKLLQSKFESLFNKTNDISPKFKLLFQSELDKAADLQAKYKSAVKVSERLKTGHNIVCVLQTIDTFNTRIAKADPNIAEPFKIIAKGFEEKFPQLYPVIVPGLAQRIEKYDAMDGYRSKADTAEKLEKIVTYFSLAYDTLKTYDQFLSSEMPVFKKSYETTYNSIYKTLFLNTDRIVFYYNDINKLDTKLNVGRELYGKLMVIKNGFDELRQIDESLFKAVQEVPAMYKDLYSPVYKAEIKSLVLQKEQYDLINSLDSKLKTGRELVVQFNYLRTAYLEMRKIDEDIQQGKIMLEGKYKTSYPKIFSSQVKADNGMSITSQEGIYQKTAYAKQKIQLGQKIVADIKKFETLFDTILIADQQIQNEFNIMSLKYKETYPKVYASEIKSSIPFSSQLTISKEIDNYLAIDLIEARIKRSQEILKKIDWYNRKISEAQEDETYIISQYPILESKYKSTYPTLYSTEIKTLNPFGSDTTLNGQIAMFKEMDNMDNKINTSKKLRWKVDFLLKAYDEMALLDKELNTQFQQIDYKYKPVFPKIYAKEINNSESMFGDSNDPTFNNELKKNAEKTSVKQRLSDAKFLKQRMEKLDENFNALTAMKQEIDEKYQKFQTTFSNDEKSEIILKKGNQIYKELNSQYEDESTAESKLKKGEQVKMLLNKLISYAGKDNSYLIDRLTKANNIVYVKAAFGINF